MAKFQAQLTASFREIRKDRALGITEDTELEYKRTIEDLTRKVRGYNRQRENLLLDLAPANITSTRVVPADFAAKDFMEKDLAIGVNKRNDTIALELAVDRYEELFGPYPDAARITDVLPSWKSKLTTETAE